tara:strand:- start:34 stop:462 length:429 start_codon:yes stop_codon:yes gene_type:complete
MIESKKKIGFTCSCFDLLHAGHVMMLQDAKNQCDHLIVGLQTDPTIDRPNEKNKPIQSLNERKVMINSIKFVDEVVIYGAEKELYSYLKENKPDIRILGSDYLGKDFTGKDLDIPIYYHNRNHNWSTSSLRKKIFIEEQNQS